MKREFSKHTRGEENEALSWISKAINALIKRYKLCRSNATNRTRVCLFFEILSQALANELLNA